MVKWALLVYLFLEVVITIDLGGRIGGLYTFFEILISAAIGIILMMNFKKVFASSLVAVMSKQVSSEQMMAGNFLSLIGAVLLVLPGFLSDIIGLLLQLDFVKTLLAARIKAPQSEREHFRNKGDDDVIDVEIIEHDALTK